MDKIKILIVDDVPYVREALQIALQLTGDFEVLAQATNGLEAVRLAEKLKPDVVLTDLQMPFMNGIEATRRIKHRHLAKRVVALSMNGDRSVRELAMEAGVDAFVKKGPNVQALFDTIRRVFGEPPKIQPDGIEREKGNDDPL